MSVARIEVHKREKEQLGMEPKKFLLWAFLVTVTMLFGGLTSAIVVRRGDGNWMHFNIPVAFTISTVLIVISSVTMQWAYVAAKRNLIRSNRIALWFTTVLGIIFLYSQYMGYKQLVANGIYLNGNPSGSFVYVISFIHALHIIGGVFILFGTLISSYRYKVHSKSILGINLCTTYWHFIGGLWVYLFIILNAFR